MLGDLRQLRRSGPRRIHPAAAQGGDQADIGPGTLARHLHLRTLGIETAALCIDALEIAGRAIAVARVGQRCSPPGSVDRFVLEGQLAVEGADVAEAVLDVLEGHQHLPPIRRHRPVVPGIGLVQPRLIATTVEQGHVQHRA
ncbi:hypothetical protein D3C76_1363440 [compost metagenome]